MGGGNERKKYRSAAARDQHNVSAAVLYLTALLLLVVSVLIRAELLRENAILSELGEEISALREENRLLEIERARVQNEVREYELSLSRERGAYGGEMPASERADRVTVFSPGDS